MLGKDGKLKDIVVALINNRYFPEYREDTAENCAKDVATFVKTFYEEVSK